MKGWLLVGSVLVLATLFGAGSTLLLGVWGTHWPSGYSQALTAIGPVINAATLAGLLAITGIYAFHTQQISTASRQQADAAARAVLDPKFAGWTISGTYKRLYSGIQELLVEVKNIGSSPALNMQIRLREGASEWLPYRTYGRREDFVDDWGRVHWETEWATATVFPNEVFTVGPDNSLFIGFRPEPFIEVPETEAPQESNTIAVLLIEYENMNGSRVHLERDIVTSWRAGRVNIAEGRVRFDVS